MLRVPRVRRGDADAPQVVPVAADVAPDHLFPAGKAAQTKLPLFVLGGLARAFQVVDRVSYALCNHLECGVRVLHRHGVRASA